MKLVSGIMMLLLGGLLVVKPEALNNVLVAIGILFAAIGLSWLSVKYFDPAKKA